jgi:hypothetical protein
MIISKTGRVPGKKEYAPGHVINKLLEVIVK